VPFPWESRLSDVAAPEYKGAGWYEREITIPSEWSGYRPFLCFGAVDWSARVWLNGRLVAEHENGYLPFAVDLSDHFEAGQSGQLIVRAYDVSDGATLVGKQVPRWYTHSSGIWQPVWLEARGQAGQVDAVRIEPNPSAGQARVRLDATVKSAETFVLRLTSPDEAFPPARKRFDLGPGHHSIEMDLPIPSPRLWSPESPFLYRVAMQLDPILGGACDRFETYFGMRTVGRGAWNGKEYEYVLLNGEPVYLRGALDQAFHPDGIYSYPTDDHIRNDLTLARELGLNLLRCHIKLNDPRYYYWADRLGVLILSDLPCADVDSPSARRHWKAVLRGAIARDFNHPSIVGWVLFNETWGLDNHDRPEGRTWVRSMYDLAKSLDPTRLVEDNSPCLYDHVVTDLNSWHFYINDYDQARRHVERVVAETYAGSRFNYVGEQAQGTEPLINSEYAGISASMGDQDISWSFKYLTTELRRHAKIGGYVYTELTDIEWEHNGFVNYDRSRKEFGYDFFVPGMSVADLNSPDFVGFAAPPCQTVPPGADFVAPVFVSHFGPAMANARVGWRVMLLDRFGQSSTFEAGEWVLNIRRFDVLTFDPGPIRLPRQPGLATIALELMDETGGVRTRNYVNVELRDPVGPTSERGAFTLALSHGERRPVRGSTRFTASEDVGSSRVERLANSWALRFAPGDVARTSWPQPTVEPSGAKFAAPGVGWVEFDVAVPPEVDLARVRRLIVRFEAGARAGMKRIDWPQQTRGRQYPQTEEKKFPSDLTVSLNSVEVLTTRLPDDPADARGALSHHRDYDPGSYGYLVEQIVEGPALDAAREVVSRGKPLRLRLEVRPDALERGGLSLYGEALGCYPVDPMIVVETE
jgi:hypothetical protein